MRNLPVRASPWLPANRTSRNTFLPSQDTTLGGKSAEIVCFKRSTVWLAVVAVTVTNIWKRRCELNVKEEETVNSKRVEDSPQKLVLSEEVSWRVLRGDNNTPSTAMHCYCISVIEFYATQIIQFRTKLIEKFLWYWNDYSNKLSLLHF